MEVFDQINAEYGKEMIGLAAVEIEGEGKWTMRR